MEPRHVPENTNLPEPIAIVLHLHFTAGTITLLLLLCCYDLFSSRWQFS